METGLEAIAFAVITHAKLLAQHQVLGEDEGRSPLLGLTATKRASLPCGVRVHGKGSCSWVQLVPFPFVPELSHASSHVPKAEHPHASAATWLHAMSLVRCECTIWRFAEGHPGPSATSSGGKHLLDRRVQVQSAMGDVGR